MDSHFEPLTQLWYDVIAPRFEALKEHEDQGVQYWAEVLMDLDEESLHKYVDVFKEIAKRVIEIDEYFVTACFIYGLEAKLALRVLVHNPYYLEQATRAAYFEEAKMILEEMRAQHEHWILGSKMQAMLKEDPLPTYIDQSEEHTYEGKSHPSILIEETSQEDQVATHMDQSITKAESTSPANSLQHLALDFLQQPLLVEETSQEDQVATHMEQSIMKVESTSPVNFLQHLALDFLQQPLCVHFQQHVLSFIWILLWRVVGYYGKVAAMGCLLSLLFMGSHIVSIDSII